MHPRVQRIKTNAECSHSISFVAACGIREIHLLINVSSMNSNKNNL